MRKIRILQFPIRDSNGGITHYAMNNWRHLDKTRFECDFGTVSKYLPFENEIKQLGAGLHYISCYAEENKKLFVDEVREILIKGRYDVVHLHTSFWKSFLMEEIALECGIPKIIVHSHSTKVDIQNKQKRLEAERLHEIRKQEFNTSLATDFWACSNLAADWLFGPQIPRNRIKIMNNAIDVKKFVFNAEVREQYRRELGIEGCFVVGHVGRMCYPKNHKFLLNAFGELVQRKENVRLLLVGDGPLRDDILCQMERLNITDKVLFLGGRSDVPQLLQAMDVFCLPSKFEGLPIVLIEAQSAGLKCLISNVVTNESKLTENVDYLPLEIDQWANALFELSRGYERSDMYEKITAAGYNINQQISEVERLYLA